MGHFKKVCRSKRDHMVHEVEMEMAQGPQEEVIETVSINSVYLNRNQCINYSTTRNAGGQNHTRSPIQN